MTTAAGITRALASLALCAVPGAGSQETEEIPREALLARELFPLLASGDEAGLREQVESSAWLVESVVEELLRQASLFEPGGEVEMAPALDAARRLARIADGVRGSTLLEESVARFQALGETGRRKRLELEGLRERAHQAATARQPVEAEPLAEQCVALALELGDPWLEARERRLLGEIRSTGNGPWKPAESEIELLRIIAIDAERSLFADLAYDLRSLGYLDQRQGQLASALEHYLRANSVAEEIGEEAPVNPGSIGVLYANVGRYAEAREALESGIEQACREADAGGEAYFLTARGSLESARGDYAEALRFIARANEVRSRSADPSGQVLGWVQQAGILSEIGRTGDALEVLEQALQLVEAQHTRHQEDVLAMQGLVLVDAGRFEEALEPLSQAAVGSQGDVSVLLHADVMHHRGRALLGLERFEEAAERFSDAHELRADAGDPFGAALSLTCLGDVRDRQGRWIDAEPCYDYALETAANLDTPEASWRARYGLGRVAETKGKGSEALEHYRAAIVAIEAIRGLLGAPSLRLEYLSDKLDLYRRSAKLAALAGLREESFAFCEAGKARALLELTASGRAATESGTKASEGPTDLEQRWLEAEARLAHSERCLADRRRSSAPRDELDELRGRVRSARTEHEAARLAVELARPREAALSGLGSPATLAEVQAALAEREVLLEFLDAPGGVSLWIVRRGSARFLVLDAEKRAIHEAIARIRRPIDRLREGRTDLANLRFDAGAARELCRALIEPLAADLVGCERLWIVPDGELRLLPFALLVTELEKRPVDPSLHYAQYLGCRFLIEDFAIGYLPSAAFLLHATPELGPERAMGGPKGHALAVADPHPIPSGFPFLAAREETDAVSAAFEPGSVRILSGGEATEFAVELALASVSRAHFAVHAFLDDARPAYSRLALAPGRGDDGWIHAFEIERLSLASPHVVLSACETLEGSRSGEGLLGLSRSFLAAGARSVVGTLWVVDDQASAWLMKRYYAHIAEGVDAVEALRRAQVETLREGRRGSVSLVHPFFWAGFLHLGAA